MLPVWCRLWGLFLSTPSARRATEARVLCGPHGSHFYPRPPRGGRRILPQKTQLPMKFLSTPSARRATSKRFIQRRNREFLSTPSARRATFSALVVSALPTISIHALREEGDQLRQGVGGAGRDFYPRPPRGGRPILRSAVLAAKGISIHALREEGDVVRDGPMLFCC